jgi:hypothetical protein
MNPNDREDIMRHWNSWRRYIAEGGEASWPRDAFESLLDHFEEQIPSNSISRFEYDDLLEKICWYFETMDAMNSVYLLVIQDRVELEAYKELYIWARDAESDLRELIK